MPTTPKTSANARRGEELARQQLLELEREAEKKKAKALERKKRANDQMRQEMSDANKKVTQ